MNNIPLIPPPPPPTPINSTNHFDEILFSSEEEEINNEFVNLDFQNLIIDEKDKNNSDYLCPICKLFLIPDTCVELKCGHLFCNSCLTTLNSHSLVMGTTCPLCQEKSSSLKFIKKNNRFAYKILCGINIKCPNKECKETLVAGNLQDHIKKCEFETVDCYYCDQKNIFRKDLKKHYIDEFDSHFLKLINEVENLKQQLDKKQN